MKPPPYLSPLRFGDLRYSTLTDDTPRVHPEPSTRMPRRWANASPPTVNTWGCECPRDLFVPMPPTSPKRPRFSGNAHQRRVKRRAWERARRKEAKPFRPHLYNSPTGAGGFADGQQPHTVVTP